MGGGEKSGTFHCSLKYTLLRVVIISQKSIGFEAVESALLLSPAFTWSHRVAISSFAVTDCGGGWQKTRPHEHTQPEVLLLLQLRIAGGLAKAQAIEFSGSAGVFPECRRVG